MKVAVVTGITGQDGAYLTELLLSLGYQVHGTYRRSSTPNFWRIEALGLTEHPNLHLREYDITDPGASLRLIEKTQPDEVYNLAAQSFVHVSFDQPLTTGAITGFGPVHLLEAIRTVNPRIRFYQASSAEMFGSVRAVPQDEDTPFYPRSPYGTAKLYAHWMTVNYREAFGMFAASGILFNHESPLRGPEFVTRKISMAVARISAGTQTQLKLGHLDAKRDWGFARDYVRGMVAMLQAPDPDSFVLATGRTETVRDFATMSFRAAGIELEWKGKGAEERGLSTLDGAPLVVVDPTLYRPAEVDLLIGNASKARLVLKWEAGTRLEALCSMMVEADLKNVDTAARGSGRLRPVIEPARLVTPSSVHLVRRQTAAWRRTGASFSTE